MASKDGGKNWSEHFYILGMSTVSWKVKAGGMRETAPGWHVSSIALPDDVILTVYNRGSLVVTEDGAQVERGKAVLAVRWKLDGMELPPLSFPGVIAKPNAQGYLDNGRWLLKSEHLIRGGDYFHEDEILVCTRIPAEHIDVGPSEKGPIVGRGPEGNLFVCAFLGDIYRSTEEGRAWQRVATVKPGDEIQSFGVLNDGTMLVHFMNGSLVRSEDGGQTWCDPFRLDVSPFDRIGSANCMRINQLPDGTVLLTSGNLMLDNVSIPSLQWDGIFRSRDGGKTWGDLSHLGPRSCESNLLRLKSGRMVAVIRVQGPVMTDEFIVPEPDAHVVFIKNVSLAYSDDDGYTWSKPWSVTRFFQCPGDLVEMDDGRIVLSYMEKMGATGPRAMISRDEGRTWDSRFYILSWRQGQGHTSSVGLKDGNVITLTSEGRNGHAIIWRPLD